MDGLDTHDPANPGTTQDGTGNTPADKPRTFTQEEVNRLVAREVGKVKAQLDPIARQNEELARKAATLEAERQKAEEATLSQAQRAELEYKRNLEGYERKVKDLSDRAERERARRHDLLLKAAATDRVSRVSTKLFNPELSTDVADLVKARLVVTEDGTGNEVVHIRMGDATEPLTDETWAKFEASTLTRYYATQGGSGARHGGGVGTGQRSMKGLSASELFELGAQGLKPR